jgi:hypothetical protein
MIDGDAGTWWDVCQLVALGASQSITQQGLAYAIETLHNNYLPSSACFKFVSPMLSIESAEFRIPASPNVESYILK